MKNTFTPRFAFPAPEFTRQRHGLGTNIQWENFSSHNPCNGAPGRGKECNVDADKCDQDLLAGHILSRDRHSDNGNQEFTDEHTSRTDEQEATTASFVDEIDARNGHANIDYVGSNRDEERIFDTRVLEECRAIVEDEVDTGELLPSLQEDSGHDASEDLVRSLPEAIRIRAAAELLLRTL
ncbi:unnamed protein product, partial [Rhizoctonia solani]